MPDDRAWQQRAIDAECEVARLLAVLARIRREVVLADPRAPVGNAPPVTPERTLKEPGPRALTDLLAVGGAWPPWSGRDNAPEGER